jgi:hypothetical protein
MRTVRKTGLAQRFRPYTGPRPAPFSKAQALQRGNNPDPYSLGLWDVGMVKTTGTVTWTPAWIVASERYLEHMSDMSLGGPIQPSATPVDRLKSKPGWARYITMYDARTGKVLLSYVF